METRQFYEAILPEHGEYCVASIHRTSFGTTRDGKPFKIKHKYTSDFEEFLSLVERSNEQELVNTYFTPSTFDTNRRNASNSEYLKSFWLDIDCGEDKPYADYEEAGKALDKFVSESGLPEPIRMVSGRGMYAFWVLNEPVAPDTWKSSAERLKKLTADLGFEVDTAVTADSARLVRAPETLNWGKEEKPNDPPLPSFFITEELLTYSFDTIQEILSAVEIADTKDPLSDVMRGLDEDTRKMLGHDNFKWSFERIAERSVEDEGCAQIKWGLINSAECPEPMWRSILSIAVLCEDGDTAIHKLSEDHPNYSPEETERKADEIRKAIKGAHTCATFESHRPGGCDGCPHRGKFNSPIALGKVFKEARQPAATEEAKEEAESLGYVEKDTSFYLPDYLRPFMRGESGGLYYQPPPRNTPNGIVNSDPVLLTMYDFWPTARLHSMYDGECLSMRLTLPKDGHRDFLLPMKSVSAPDELKKILSSNGLFAESKQKADLLMNYIFKWGTYLQQQEAAKIMKFQQGWSQDKKSYLIYNKEYTRDGVIDCPPTGKAENATQWMKPKGTYEKWRWAIDKLNDPGYDLHRYVMLRAFGSPLVTFTNVNGSVVGLLGNTGAAKSGAMYAAVSTYGQPKNLSVFDSTANGLVERMLTLKNHAYGLDEFSNQNGEFLSDLVYKLSAGQAKIRLTGSTNAERLVAFSSAMLATITMNQSARDKIAGYKKNSGAEMVRYIEYEVEKPSEPGYELTAERGVDMFQTLQENYGHALPMYIQHLLSLDLEIIEKRIKDWTSRVVEDLKNFSEYRFIHADFACTFCGAELANEAGVIDVDVEATYKYMLKRVIGVVSKYTNVELDYEALLGEFINNNLNNMLVMKDGKVITEPRGTLLIRADADKGLLYVAKTPLKEFISKGNAGITQFERVLTDANIMTANNKKVRLGTGWKTSTGLSSVYAYEFTTNVQEVIANAEEKAATGTDAD